MADDILCLNIDPDSEFARTLEARDIRLETPQDLADLNRFLMYNPPKKR